MVKYFQQKMSDVRRGPQPKKLNTDSWVKGRQAVGTKHVKETPPDLRLITYGRSTIA